MDDTQKFTDWARVKCEDCGRVFRSPVDIFGRATRKCTCRSAKKAWLDSGWYVSPDATWQDLRDALHNLK